MIATLLASVSLALSGVAPTTQKVQLTEEQSRSLIEAPSSVMNRPPSVHLKKALDDNEISSIVAEIVIWDESVVQQIFAYVTYAPFPISATRMFTPKVLCATYEKGTWFHCQDESFIVATLEGFQPVSVSDSISDRELKSIFEFIDDSELLTAGMQPIGSKYVSGVNTLGGGMAVHLWIHEEKPSVYLKWGSEGLEIWGGDGCHSLTSPESKLNGVEAQPNKSSNADTGDAGAG